MRMRDDLERMQVLENRVKYLEEVALRLLENGGLLEKMADKIAELDELV